MILTKITTSKFLVPKRKSAGLGSSVSKKVFEEALTLKLDEKEREEKVYKGYSLTIFYEKTNRD